LLVHANKAHEDLDKLCSSVTLQHTSDGLRLLSHRISQSEWEHLEQFDAFKNYYLMKNAKRISSPLPCLQIHCSMIYDTVIWTIFKDLFLIEERSLKMFQTLVIRCSATPFLFILHGGIFLKEGGKMALFHAQFSSELINYINSTQNVRLCVPCICVVTTTRDDLRMFSEYFQTQ